MSSAFLEGGHSADIHEFFFKLQNIQIWNLYNWKGVYLLKVRNGIFKSRNVQIIAVTSRKRMDLLMFRVRNVEICAVLSSNEVDLLMPKNYVFIHRNDQKCAVHS